MASKNSERDSEISRRIDELIRSVANIQTSTQAHKHTLSQAHRRRSRLIHIRQLGWERWRVIESQLKTAASESSESSNRSQMSFPRSSAHLSGYQKSASRVSFGPYSPLERYSCFPIFIFKIFISDIKLLFQFLITFVVNIRFNAASSFIR